MEEVGCCRRCGELTDEHVELTGKLELTMRLCGRCSDDAFMELGQLRRQFDSLLKAGVGREMANQIMIQQIEARPS